MQLPTLLALLVIVAAPAGPAPGGAPAHSPSPVAADRRTGLADVPMAAFTAAAARGDKAELARWAERLGPARLGALLGTRERATVLAALQAVPLVEGGARLLGPVARLLSSDDLAIQESAARVIGRLLNAERPASLEDWDIAADEVAVACAGIVRLCDAPTGPVSLRTAAVEALAEAHTFCRPAPAQLSSLVNDVWPEIRRAALMAPQLANARWLDRVGELIADPVPQVAGAAGALWCRARLPALRAAPPSDETRRRFARIRTLVLIDATPVEDAMDMLPCLALSTDPEDKRALEVLRKRRGAALGERARELGPEQR